MRNPFNRDAVNILIDKTRTSAKQGLAFFSHIEGGIKSQNGNFYQVVQLISRHIQYCKDGLMINLCILTRLHILV